MFTYLVIIKIALFKLITTYNTNFQIIIIKLSSSGKNSFVKLKLIVYFHKIKTIYPNFAAAQRLLAEIKISKLLIVISKLEGEKK